MAGNAWSATSAARSARSSRDRCEGFRKTSTTQLARGARPSADGQAHLHFFGLFLRFLGVLATKPGEFLHDCCREDDGTDPGHCERAAEFSLSLRGNVLHLGDADFALLHHAIRDHERGLTKGDITVLTCWDADRLDLGRVGIRPDPRYLCTAFAREEGTIEWALQRSEEHW